MVFVPNCMLFEVERTITEKIYIQHFTELENIKDGERRNNWSAWHGLALRMWSFRVAYYSPFQIYYSVPSPKC